MNTLTQHSCNSFYSNHHSTISWCSLDPDSLEIERLPYSITKSSTHPTISMSTTVSHNVENDRSVSTFSVNNANAIYAEPKSILRRNPQTICETEDTNYLKGMRRQTIGPIYGNVNIGSNKGEELYCKSNEIFVDSLEPFVEVATSF